MGSCSLEGLAVDYENTYIFGLLPKLTDAPSTLTGFVLYLEARAGVNGGGCQTEGV
ncbi:hypothetical protein M422DRAFT_26236 [Sphaerobolus stellatus SS14]|uniref:Uncharacterized protein n=1 Tax=Sphaerobolus stellatus (strain SS14) TaxID=990650 RepID=A0A0C9U7C4_SPHS4|nr:hypothetical protein M422DRAFT_38954 [Sphaerobolus stellatus SS14]KIJ52669.1 hypothetical protein M422DRAFT_26236 [Sphaerobolus stellatus SS14]